ncbi:MAG: polysaccharide deacetylase family protein [Bacteroidota bacterium]|nr:polysaccharide deacetylase family protein [Bacteroidota bacterium]
MNGQVLLSFDVEEFDIPLEYGFNIEPGEQLAKGKKGLDMLMPLLDFHKISCTMFTTANFGMHYPDSIRKLAENHEIASHTFYHSSFQNSDLVKSKATLESITGKKVVGLRMPKMQKVESIEILKAGYTYDSSINPTWLPGRYNNLNKPRTLFIEDEIFRIPATVSPMMRLPLFWLGFKNYPYNFFKHLCLTCLKSDGYVCLYFHPWEFIDLSNYNLPRFIKNPSGGKLLERIDKMINDLKMDHEFINIQSFLETKQVRRIE